MGGEHVKHVNKREKAIGQTGIEEVGHKLKKQQERKKEGLTNRNRLSEVSRL